MAEQTDTSEKVAKAFRSIICRKAQSKELSILTDYFQSEKSAFETKPADADKLIAIGEYDHKAVPNKAGLAAMIEVIMTIYNMEEAIVRS